MFPQEKSELFLSKNPVHPIGQTGFLKSLSGCFQAENEEPQEQVVTAFGLRITN